MVEQLCALSCVCRGDQKLHALHIEILREEKNRSEGLDPCDLPFDTWCLGEKQPMNRTKAVGKTTRKAFLFLESTLP